MSIAVVPWPGMGGCTRQRASEFHVTLGLAPKKPYPEGPTASRRGRKVPPDRDPGAGRPFAGRPQLGRVRPRGHRRRAGGRRFGRAHGDAAGHPGHRRAAGRPGRLLPPGDRRVPGRRWSLRGGEEGSGQAGQPDGRRQPHHRLRPHRRRQSRRRRREPRIGVSRPFRSPSGRMPDRAVRPHRRQSARHRGQRAGADAAHSAVHRQRVRGHRRRAVSGPSRSHGRDVPALPRRRGAGRAPGAQGVLRGMLGADRGGGHRQRRSDVPPTTRQAGATHRADAGVAAGRHAHRAVVADPPPSRGATRAV